MNEKVSSSLRTQGTSRGPGLRHPLILRTLIGDSRFNQLSPSTQLGLGFAELGLYGVAVGLACESAIGITPQAVATLPKQEGPSTLDPKTITQETFRQEVQNPEGQVRDSLKKSAAELFNTVKSTIPNATGMNYVAFADLTSDGTLSTSPLSFDFNDSFNDEAGNNKPFTASYSLISVTTPGSNGQDETGMYIYSNLTSETGAQSSFVFTNRDGSKINAPHLNKALFFRNTDGQLVIGIQPSGAENPLPVLGMDHAFDEQGNFAKGLFYSFDHSVDGIGTRINLVTDGLKDAIGAIDVTTDGTGQIVSTVNTFGNPDSFAASPTPAILEISLRVAVPTPFPTPTPLAEPSPTSTLLPSPSPTLDGMTGAPSFVKTIVAGRSQTPGAEPTGTSTPGGEATSTPIAEKPTNTPTRSETLTSGQLAEYTAKGYTGKQELIKLAPEISAEGYKAETYWKNGAVIYFDADHTPKSAYNLTTGEFVSLESVGYTPMEISTNPNNPKPATIEDFDSGRATWSEQLVAKPFNEKAFLTGWQELPNDFGDKYIIIDTEASKGTYRRDPNTRPEKIVSYYEMSLDFVGYPEVKFGIMGMQILNTDGTFGFLHGGAKINNLQNFADTITTNSIGFFISTGSTGTWGNDAIGYYPDTEQLAGQLTSTGNVPLELQARLLLMNGGKDW